MTTTKPPERLIFPAGITDSTELRTVPALEDPDGPRFTGTPTTRDVANAIACATDEWFGEFVTELKRRDIRVAAAALFKPLPPSDPDFGVDPEDSERLLELRDVIDSYLGWKSQEDEEAGDYVFRIREIGDMLWNCKAAFIEHQDADLMAKIMLSVTKQHEKHPQLAKFDRAQAYSAKGQCSCMSAVHAHPSGVCGAEKAEWFREEGWPDALMLCPVCIKHPADEEILRLSKKAERGEKLVQQNHRQRAELRRFNRDARARAESAQSVVRDGALMAVRRLHDYLKSQSPHWATERTVETMQQFLGTWLEHEVQKP